MLGSPGSDDAHRIVPPPLDTHIPTDDELDAQCDRLMRFDAVSDPVVHAVVPRRLLRESRGG